MAGRPVTSFRDPSGFLIRTQDRILRVVRRAGLPNSKAFFNSGAVRSFQQAGKIVGTREVPLDEAKTLLSFPELKDLIDESDIASVIEHDRMSFPSFVYEWAPEMLHEAGRLTLDLAKALLNEGLGIKDATPYNVLFNGSKAVFVDTLSIEPRDPCDPVWLPYSQFTRTILIPLLLNRSFGIGLDSLIMKQDGLWPADVRKHFGPIAKLLPPALTLVSIPSWLSSRGERADTTVYQKKTFPSREKARFVLGSLFAGLDRNLRRVRPADRRTSAWTDYAAEGHFDPAYVAPKKSFVERALAEVKPKATLDIGCNTGEFSLIAARNGSNVVSIDSDPAVVGRLWRTADRDGLSIQPLVVDISRPTPSVGWQNRECASFLDRARGGFDAVLMLAVIHHLMASAGIPLASVVSLASELTRDALIAEFVPPEDPMFRSLSRGRDHLFASITREFFEDAFSRHFEIVHSQELAPTARWIYLLRKSRG